MPRNPLTVHDPDPSGFTLCVWDCSCLTLPSRGSFTPWAGHAASQPPSSSGAPPKLFLVRVSIWNMGEESPWCCAKPHIHTNVFKVCRVLKRADALPSRELACGLRKKRPKKAGGGMSPTSAFKLGSPGFSFSTLLPPALPRLAGGRNLWSPLPPLTQKHSVSSHCS